MATRKMSEDDFIRQWWKKRFPDADPPKWDSAITCADASDLLRAYYKHLEIIAMTKPTEAGARSMQTVSGNGCIMGSATSRICERGTPFCEVEHDKASLLPDAEPGSAGLSFVEWSAKSECPPTANPIPVKRVIQLATAYASYCVASRDRRVQELREAIVAAVPFLFEHGAHADKRCYRGSDDGCYCGLDESKKIVETALRRTESEEK